MRRAWSSGAFFCHRFVLLQYDKLDVHEFVDGTAPSTRVDLSRPIARATLDISDLPGARPRPFHGSFRAPPEVYLPLATRDIEGASPQLFLGKKRVAVEPKGAVDRQDSFGHQNEKHYWNFRATGPRALFPTVARHTVLKRPPVLRGMVIDQ